MAKRHFTEEEVEEAVWEYGIDTNFDEPRRWSRRATTIVKMEDDGRLYSLYWEKGLTEQLEDSYNEQDADEVVKVTKMIEVTSWVVRD